MNRLAVSLQQSIHTLHARGWSARRIARELDLHRETVGREIERSKPAKVTTGSEAAMESKPAKVTTGSEGRSRSQCEEWRTMITESLQAGLSARRIFQDLQTEKSYSGGYESVKRFVRALAAVAPLPFRRIETAPGDELQVDFGQGAPVIDPTSGKRRRPHLFRATLSFSRKGYSEVVWRQDTETFLRCLENAFRHFGGVAKTVIPDNLKAAVLQADWFDPELNPKLTSFAEHYGTVILPTKPRTPQHKGKVEAGVKYVQNNALKGRSFESLTAQNQFLDQWEARIADTRIHGTVREQVAALFAKQEKPALQPLPAGLFPCFHEAQRSVHRDGYVEYKKAYYSVPPEHVGRQVWVRGDSKLLHIYTLLMRQIAVHTLAEPGRFATDQAHVHPHKRNAIERGGEYLLERCKLIGPHSGAWAAAMYGNRGPIGMRVLQGLLQLARKHPVGQLEQASEKAVRHSCWRLRDLRRLMEQGDQVVQVDFLQEHELIRDLSAYRIDGFSPSP
jgi:transposase